MVMPMSYLHAELPPVALSLSDTARLSKLADAAANTFPATADFLAREIERAEIFADDQLSRHVVRMGSQVRFRDDVTLQEREVTLVYPELADVAAGKISVLTPIGAALIGLSVSQTIEFRTPAGGRRSLTVLQVRHTH
jgi:regulator of nucleoside diphosphate kinase